METGLEGIREEKLMVFSRGEQTLVFDGRVRPAGVCQ